MTLEEAIAISEQQLTDHPHHHSTPFFIAIKLGIEALKRLHDNRRDPEFDHWLPLPGETAQPT